MDAVSLRKIITSLTELCLSGRLGPFGPVAQAALSALQCAIAAHLERSADVIEAALKLARSCGKVVAAATGLRLAPDQDGAGAASSI